MGYDTKCIYFLYKSNTSNPIEDEIRLNKNEIIFIKTELARDFNVED